MKSNDICSIYHQPATNQPTNQPPNHSAKNMREMLKYDCFYWLSETKKYLGVLMTFGEMRSQINIVFLC